jgi:hypothetical protein
MIRSISCLNRHQITTLVWLAFNQVVQRSHTIAQIVFLKAAIFLRQESLAPPAEAAGCVAQLALQQ